MCLLYADDALLFLKPTSNQIVKVKLLFHIFGDITGLKINLSKSELSITSADFSLTQALASIIQCAPKTFPMRYLGMPLSDRRLARTDYLPLLNKIQNALAGWKAPLLSVGGRYILTNAVLTAIPQFLMSIFLLPKWLLRKIDQIRRKFLWHGHKGQQGQLRKMYMVNWAITTRPKKLGGLGVRDIHIANQALLMRWMWQWLHHDHAWWKQVTPMSNQFDRPWDDPNANPFWKNMANIAPAFNASLKHQIRNGERIQFWHDNWNGTALKFLFPEFYKFIRDKHSSVAQSAHANGWNFQHHPLTTTTQIEKEQLLALLQDVQITQVQDAVTWIRSSKGFTASSAYNFLSLTPAPTSHLGNIYSIKAPLRITIFTWLMITNRLATIDNLVRKGWHLPNMCTLCRRDEENASHIFQTCTLTQQVRRYIFVAFADRFSISPKFKGNDSISMLTDTKEHINTRRWEIVTCFVLWRERCRRVFSDKELRLIPLVREIRAEYGSWFDQKSPI